MTIFLQDNRRIFTEIIDDLLCFDRSCELRSIDEYRLLSDREYHNIIYGWNQTDINYQAKQGGYKITFCNNQLEVDATLNAIIKRRKTRGYQNYG